MHEYVFIDKCILYSHVRILRNLFLLLFSAEFEISLDPSGSVDKFYKYPNSISVNTFREILNIRKL